MPVRSRSWLDRRRHGGALGPLHGIPVAIKDNLQVAGLPTAWGGWTFDGIAAADELPVARLRAAGAITAFEAAPSVSEQTTTIVAVQIEGRAMFTNSPPFGAFRGFGAPQSQFACERHMDRIADELGIDPIDLRRRNLIRPGESTATGQVIDDGADREAVMDRALDLSGFDARRADHGRFNESSLTHRRGIGLATFFPDRWQRDVNDPNYSGSTPGVYWNEIDPSVPVAGVASLRNHIVDGCVEGQVRIAGSEGGDGLHPRRRRVPALRWRR